MTAIPDPTATPWKKARVEVRIRDASGTYRSNKARMGVSRTRLERSPTFAPNSMPWGAMSRVATTPNTAAKTTRARRPDGIVFGSVIMNNWKMRISGEVTSVSQKSAPHTGSGAQVAAMQ